MLKDVILAYLTGGEYVSGEMIARQNNVTRNAVWNAVRQLRAQGYEIDSATNSGYRLVRQPDILDREEILSGLGVRAEEFDVILYDELDSTNCEAFGLARRGAPAGTVVIADRQTAGMGRLGRSFFSPPGCGIYMSLILRPQIPPAELPRLTSFSAVAVAQAVDRLYGMQTGIKWVNDLFLNGKKFCGILSQASFDMESGGPGIVVIGIGINVLRTQFPPELASVAGSLEELTGRRVSRSAIIPEILTRLYVADFVNSDYIDEYRQRSIILGKNITVNSIRDSYTAAAVEINDRAALIVRLEDGSLRTVETGDVSVRLK